MAEIFPLPPVVTNVISGINGMYAASARRYT
jgi:hypothetical protein